MSIAKPFEVRHPTREDCEGDGSSMARTDRAVNTENWLAGLALLAMTVGLWETRRMCLSTFWEPGITRKREGRLIHVVEV
jgi:hypothetical protein